MIRIIGLGSPFGADRAGWEAVRQLRDRCDSPVDWLILDRPGPALINSMADTDHLIILDAVLGDHRSAPFVRIDPAHTIPAADAGLSNHGLQLAQTLELATALGVSPTKIEIYGIPVGEPASIGYVEDSPIDVAPLVDHLLEELHAASIPGDR